MNVPVGIEINLDDKTVQGAVTQFSWDSVARSYAELFVDAVAAD